MTGCIRQEAMETQKSSISTVKQSETPMPEITMTVKPFSSETATKTVTPQSIPITPIPTIENEMLEEYIYDLMSDNGNCSLPCWWGMSPGKTSAEKVVSFLDHFGVKVYVNNYQDDQGDSVVYSPKFDLERITSDFRIRYIEADNLLRSIFVIGMNLDSVESNQDLWNNYTPDQILANYGVPTRVFLRAPGVTGFGDTGYMGYILWLVYDDLGFIVRYDGNVRDLPIFHICPSLNKGNGQITRINIYMQSPDDARPLSESDSILISSETDEYWIGTVKPIDEAAGISVEEFYQLFMQTEEPTCFDSPHDIWPKK